jgi:hypothetical protein
MTADRTRKAPAKKATAKKTPAKKPDLVRRPPTWRSERSSS